MSRLQVQYPANEKIMRQKRSEHWADIKDQELPGLYY
jgi:hypothetical protein